MDLWRICIVRIIQRFLFFFFSWRILNILDDFRHLKEPEAVLECVLKSKVTVLPGHIQAVFIHNLMKLYAHILRKASTAEEKERARQVNFPIS